MKRLLTTLIILTLLFTHHFSASTVSAANPPLFKVLKVVDGDTIVVDVRGNRETVRLLGIDTPESVDPRKPVQCYGRAAAEKIKSYLSGKSVILVDDNTQGNRDRYRRLLRYVYSPDSVRTFINGEMIKQGFAFSYREYPTKMTEKFNRLENYARENNLGLWGSCPESTTEKNRHQSITQNVRQLPGAQTQTSVVNTVGDKDCQDFTTHTQAQAFFMSQGGPANDPHKLDGNHDGKACESLP